MLMDKSKRTEVEIWHQAVCKLRIKIKRYHWVSLSDAMQANYNQKPIYKIQKKKTTSIALKLHDYGLNCVIEITIVGHFQKALK